MGQAGAWPQGQLQARLQVDEHHRAMFELAADDAGRRQAQAVAVKAQRTFQVVHGEGDDADAGLHGLPPC
ncbi:hypothetical protein D3C84_1264170 [compost metagenome]